MLKLMLVMRVPPTRPVDADVPADQLDVSDSTHGQLLQRLAEAADPSPEHRSALGIATFWLTGCHFCSTVRGIRVHAVSAPMFHSI